ncbi:MAG: thiol peroxidase [Muribaculaceae bacterium]|nr:thiol peroxidase [Muribaculaceae bacterium]
METIFFNGTAVKTYGNVPVAGEKAPDFKLVNKELKELSFKDFEGKRIVLNVFPSLDTAVCAASVRRFNQEAAKFKNTVVLCVSMDLPFAMTRFCTAEGIDGVVPASAFRSPDFGKEYGLTMVDGPLAGLLARAVIIIDENRNVIYSDLVDEITHEPDYDGAFYVLTND